MPDTYMPGVPGYQHNADTDTTTSQQNELYKALLSQTMQQGPNTGMGGIIAKMLGTYATMQGMQPQGLTANAGAAGGMQPLPDSAYGVNLPTPGYTSPVG